MFDSEVLKFIELCKWDTARFLIISNNVSDQLIYYSHLMPLVSLLFLGIFLFFKNRQNLAIRWLLITIILLSFWLFFDLIIWATEKPSFVMFFWSLLTLIEPVIYAGAFLFVYYAIDNKNIPSWLSIFIFVLLLPTAILTPTRFNLVSFNLSNCERNVIEGPLVFYGYLIEVILSIFIVYFCIRKIIQTKISEERKKITLILLGVLFFLLFFSLGNTIGSIYSNWYIGQYGLFGIPVFLFLLSYAVVKYKAFNIKLTGVQFLVVVIWIALLSLLFVKKIETFRIITFTTLIIFTGIGILLVRSVREEIKQREELEGLKGLTGKIYEQNLELAIKNKTLSLLEKLYQTSVLTLAPEEIAKTTTDIIRKELNLEFVGVLLFKKEIDSLIPLAFSESERLIKTLNNFNFLLDDITITNVSSLDFFKQTLYSHKENITNNLEEIWGSFIKTNYLKEVQKKSNIKTVLLEPLFIGKDMSGLLLLGFNRDYDALSAFEKTAIKNFANVIALLLDKAYLYKSLQESYEEVNRLSKAKSEFISIASHQLRTPLTAIKGYISMLLEGTYGKIIDRARKPLENVYKSNERLIRLVNDLLSISRIEAGKIEFESELTQIEEIIDEVVFEMEINAQKKGLYLKWEKSETPLPKLNLDREKMRQVILNIVDNAIKYTQEGGIEIKCEVQNSTLKIMITDTGEGMTKEDLEKIFETFSRGIVGVTTYTEGAGLGLYIAKKFVEMHGGRVWAESEGKGKGSTFYIELPMKKRT